MTLRGPSLGIELYDRGFLAVRVDDQGTVAERLERPDAAPADVASALSALDRDAAAPVGIAVPNPATVTADLAGTSRPSRVISTGSAVALGESWAGAGRGAAHVVALFADACVHAGLVVNGHPYEGAHGLAGTASWLALNPVERDDYRRLGCLEAEIGAVGIVRRLVWRLRGGDRSTVLDLAGGAVAAITTDQIFDAARGGDPVAIGVVRDTARYVGMAVANLVAMIDPDVVVLGGLLAEAGPLLMEPCRAEAMRRLPATAAGHLNVVAASLGPSAAAIGAARAAMLEPSRSGSAHHPA